MYPPSGVFAGNRRESFILIWTLDRGKAAFLKTKPEYDCVFIQ